MAAPVSVLATAATRVPSGDQAGNRNAVPAGACTTRLPPWPSTIASAPSGSTSATRAAGFAGWPSRPVATRTAATPPTASSRDGDRRHQPAAAAARRTRGRIDDRRGREGVGRRLIDHVGDDTASRPGRGCAQVRAGSPTAATAASIASARPSAIRVSSASVIDERRPEQDRVAVDAVRVARARVEQQAALSRGPVTIASTSRAARGYGSRVSRSRTSSTPTSRPAAADVADRRRSRRAGRAAAPAAARPWSRTPATSDSASRIRSTSRATAAAAGWCE